MSIVVLGDGPSIVEPNRYPCRMDLLTLFTTNTFDTIVLHLVKAVLHRAAVTIVFMK